VNGGASGWRFDYTFHGRRRTISPWIGKLPVDHVTAPKLLEVTHALKGMYA
jgi:hypothetical protein